MRGNGHKLKYKEFYLNTEKRFIFLFSCEDGQTLEWVFQRGCGFSDRGDIQNLRGYGPEQPAVSVPALRRVFGLDDLQRTFPTSAIL